MRVALLTREYPPDVYGGAGVHVEYLARELARLVDLTVHCWGSDRQPASPDGNPTTTEQPTVIAHQPWGLLASDVGHAPVTDALSINLAMADQCSAQDIVHSHTWYANFAGHLAKLLYGVPHVATVHSLEPLRPWKAEQLGGGYRVSSFSEKTALESADGIVAVSTAVAADILHVYPDISPSRVHVIHNGVDPDDYRPGGDPGILERFGVDPARPVVLFVGRITRQKGIHLLLRAAPLLPPEAQIVLRAGSADTPEIQREVDDAVAAARAAGRDVVFITDNLTRAELNDLIGSATVFCCPSVYEPFGLVNVEAMACGVPVVATAVGGIPEIVSHGETGLLVPIDALGDGTGQPRDPAAFVRDFAGAVSRLLDDLQLARKMGETGRNRVVEQFSWRQVAARTVGLYEQLSG